MNEIGMRIRELRKALKMTQEEFADSIDLERNSVSLIENGKRNASSKTLKSICRIHNANFFWLKDGIGEMFELSPDSVIDELAQDYNLSEDEIDLLRDYINLDSAGRRVIKALMQEAIKIGKGHSKT